MANDCIFCKIAKGEIPSTKVYEDDKMIGHWMSDQGITSLFCDGNTIIAPSINENDDYIEDVVLL